MYLKRIAGILLIISTLSACGNAESNDSGKYEREISDSIKADAIRANFEEKDSSVINAYISDRTTISINDIDTSDKTYTTRSKILYKPGADGKGLAIVYGYKTEGKGIAVMQKVGEKPIVLKEGEMKEGVRNYSNGKVHLQKAGSFAFIDGGQYEEVQ